MPEETTLKDFSAIRLKLASPEVIKHWSYGEVTKPETINYRTQKPEKAGLFAEEIFGPTKDWECYCGKYKRIRYKGIVCDKCGVEVTRALVRRERMGHIELAAPVSHIWFLRGVPSKIGLVLDLSIQELEKVIYFASFVVTKVDEVLREDTLKQIEAELDAKKKGIEADAQRVANEIQVKKLKDTESAKTSESKSKKIENEAIDALAANAARKGERLEALSAAAVVARKELISLHVKQIIAESQYHDLSLKYGHVFEAGIGAEAIHHLLRGVDLDQEIKNLEKDRRSGSEIKQKKAVRRLKLLKNLKANNLRPEWTILTMVPVIPPDLRPMVQLDGGRFAASDLNDLYRRVINRNNRLKRLLELNAPEVITRNEKRMLQEAVDALIDNGARHGKTVTAATGQKRQLKSIADMLKGKQGRFRQNLLGKRVDYSGRSVIVVGPHLQLHQCGLPKRMALELFKPFVIAQLIKREYVHNVRSANRFIESDRSEIWDILEEITKTSHVLLNRAPTLHRLGIQAFQPVLIEGKAIQIHPMVCTAFNADFDGDQMAVHVPLTESAKKEAAELMLSAKNLLKPATGAPVVTPEKDIVLGCFYLTMMRPNEKPFIFSSSDEAEMAFSQGRIKLHDEIIVRHNHGRLNTSVGRLVFNSKLPEGWEYINEHLGKKALSKLVGKFIQKAGVEKTVTCVDSLKNLAFEYLTKSGISWGMDDLTIPKEKAEILKKADVKVDELNQNYEMGLLTDEERHSRIIEVWDQAKINVQKACKITLDKFGPVFSMIESGARGSWGQTTQMMGMKGLVTNPAGDIIELPVRGSFKEGFEVLEYFISTHGARKGLSDTALRTANAGYLTRRLIDVAQDIVISEPICTDDEGITLSKSDAEAFGESIVNRALGRTSLQKISDPKTKKVIVQKNGLITEEVVMALDALDLDELRIRSVLTCKSKRGLCAACYGYDLGHNKPVVMGTAVGIIAAQSIGEPGTQLTMRTFHTGGVAGQDITQGLPRVEELFEARPVKKPAILSAVSGTLSIQEGEKGEKLLHIHYRGNTDDTYPIKRGYKPSIKDGSVVKAGESLAEGKGKDPLTAIKGGLVILKDDQLIIRREEDKMQEYNIHAGDTILVKDGDLINIGDQLTEGSLDLHQLYKMKGEMAVQNYLIKEIQYIYSSQGQKLNSKHLEVIVRQMFSRVYINEAYDSGLISGEIVERTQFEAANEKALAKNKKPADGEFLLFGITKASLSIDSFLSAASFQETARVLIDAAVSGKVDRLRGLKENVIIGKLIPAGTGYVQPMEPGTKEEKTA
ncbi:MAG: DNA-directed RNA polymerase subunit beta' [Patescibacteria group bacterium]|jgi:DNA-directed RNA polymerase subunit beta'